MTHVQDAPVAVHAAPAPLARVDLIERGAETLVEVPAPCCAGAEPGAGHAHHGYIGNKEAYLRRLKRIEGQARGIHRMVEEEKYCIDILTQISAVTKALQSVALGLLDDHMNHCVLAAAQDGGQAAEDKMAEVSEAIARLVRS